KCRTVLWHLVFWGFVINYMFCINLNITIVDMINIKVEQQQQQLPEQLEQQQVALTSLNNTLTTTVEEIVKQNASTIHTELKHNHGHFDWNEYQQGLILGSFYWLNWLTQLPGGILAKKYGTKFVFGLSNVVCCWLCYCIPLAAYYDYRALIVLRVIQGLIAGFTWPAMHVLIAKWIPPNERSKFVTAYFGSSIGVAFSYPLFAYIMHYMSWRWVYDFCGIVGTIWWFAWLLCVYDSPARHPRITKSELNYIQKSLGSSVQQNSSNSSTPWKAILTSRPVWMNVIGQWAGVWGLFTLMTQSPTYFKIIHNWDIRATGILSGIPHIMRMIFAYGFSLYADYLLRTNRMTRTNLRKFATAVCSILMGIMVLALAYFGHNPICAVVFITAATMFQGAGSSGPLSSMIDIAPNYAGIISGICGTIGSLPAFISAYLVGVLTLNNQTFEAWTNVFLICATVLISCGILYVIFADSALQKWNDNSEQKDAKELQLLGKHEEAQKNGCSA
ncbi:hypothetical protein DOY81_003258, partial [Sarcophaga bullata]